MDIVEQLIVYRDRPGRSRAGRELLADACNEIDRLRGEKAALEAGLKTALDKLAAQKI